MSLDVRYLTNGVKTCYVIRDTIEYPPIIETYDRLEDIPNEIAHYAADCKLTHVTPDLARILGYLHIFYPNFPNCQHPDYLEKPCIAESCGFSSGGDWTKCPHFPGYSVADS